MMDEYLDQYFSSSSWSDVYAKERVSWNHDEPIQQNQLLLTPLGVYEYDENNSAVSIISANHSLDTLAAQDTSSSVLGGELEYGIDKNLLSEEAQHEKDDRNCNGNLTLTGKMNGSLKLGNVGLQYDTAISILSPVNLGSPKQLPLVGDMTPSLSFTDTGHVGGNGVELSEVQRSVGDLKTLSPNPELWFPPSYDEVSSLSFVMGQQRTQAICLQGVNLNSDSVTVGNRYVGIDKILQFDNVSASMSAKGKQGLQNHPLSCTSARHQTTMTTVGLPSLQQTASATSTAGFNGTGKPRVRARRGQATDPHSIAERLRREKIAERMKNLQELVPNSSKTDKASMLDEIMDYVKFLQLQVKVLSMSRFGAAGAVLPLITDGQAEEPNGMSLSPHVDQGVDQVAFEEEIVKLMESNLTMAMQNLQSKGLCLMPIALAAAISRGKTSSTEVAFEEKNKYGLDQNNGSSNLPNDGNVTMGNP